MKKEIVELLKTKKGIDIFNFFSEEVKYKEYRVYFELKEKDFNDRGDSVIISVICRIERDILFTEIDFDDFELLNNEMEINFDNDISRNDYKNSELDDIDFVLSDGDFIPKYEKIKINRKILFNLFSEHMEIMSKKSEQILNYDNSILKQMYIGRFDYLENIMNLNSIINSGTLDKELLPIDTLVGKSKQYKISFIDFDEESLVLRLSREFGVDTIYECKKLAYVDFVLTKKGLYYTAINNERLDIQERNKIQNTYHIINGSKFHYGRRLRTPLGERGIQFYIIHYYKEDNDWDTGNEWFEKLEALRLKSMLEEALIKLGIFTKKEVLENNCCCFNT